MANQKTVEEIAREKKRQYYQEYYRKNRKKINEQKREWRAANPDKVRQYNENYWLRKAEELKAQ